MSGTVAVNDKGDVVLFQGDQWRPAQIAQDDKGNRLFFDGNAWSPVPGAPRPEAPAMATERAGRTDAQLEGDAGRQIGLGTRATLSGLGALPGMALDAVTYPGRALARGLGMTARAPSDMGGDLMDAAGLPRAVTPRERLVSAGVSGAAGVVPTIAAGGLPGVPNAVAQALTTAPVSQAIGGATGGLASEVAAQNNGGPVAQTLAGLAGGVAGATATSAIPAAGRAAGALVQPLTPRGREGLVAEALLRQSSAPEQLAGRIASGVDTPGLRLPESPVTTAQAARDPALLATERSIRDGALGPVPAGTLREADAARNASRVGAIMAEQDGNTSAGRGAAIRGEASGPQTGLLGAQAQRRAEVGRLYDAIDPEGASQLPLGGVRARALETAERFRWNTPAGGAAPGEAADLLADLQRLGDAAPWTDMQALRSRAGVLAGSQDGRIAEFGRQVQRSIDDAAETAGRPIEPPSRPVTLDDLTAQDVAAGEAARPDVAAALAVRERDMRPGRSLVQWLVENGGVQNQGGDLRAILDSARTRPGLWNNGGMQLDRAALAAREAGFFPEHPFLNDRPDTMTPQALLAAIDDEVRGLGRRYADRGARAERATSDRMLRNEVDRELSARGLSIYDNPAQALAAFSGDVPSMPAGPRDVVARTLAEPFTPEQAARWREATAARRQMGADFGRDVTGANPVERIVRRDQFGRPMMPDERVPGAALDSVDGVRQVLRAAGDQADTMRAQLRGEFMDRMWQAARTATDTMRASGNLEPTLSPAMFRRFFQQNEPVAREIFGPEQYQRLQVLAADFAETGATAAAGGSRNSQTAQNLSVANAISRATNGLLEPNSPLNQQIFGGAGVIARALYQQPEIVVREMLAQAMADPNFAQMLLSRASPEAMRRAVGYVEQNLAERLLQAAGGAAVRQGVRSAADSPEAELPPVIVEGRRP